MPEESGKKIEVPSGLPKREYGVGHKLIGKDYPTPDLYAKVTGQRSTPKTITQMACFSASCCSAHSLTRE